MSRAFRRGLAVAILVALLWVAGAVIVVPVAALYLDQSAGIAAAQARLGDLAARRNDPAVLAARRTSVEAIPAAQAGLLVASEAEAAARLEAHLRRIAQAHGADVANLRPAPTSTEDGVRTVRATLQLRVPDTSVLALLHAFETGSPAVVFESLVLRRPDPIPAGAGALRIEFNAALRVHLEPPAATGPRS